MPGLIDVIIVGAGPYGLSLASHLSASGVNFRIFGKPMDAWKGSMPAGMHLKSHAWSSSLSDPHSELTLPAYCAKVGIPLGDADTPPLGLFVAYAEAFQKRFVPNVETKRLMRLTNNGRLFQAEFEDGEVVEAKKVILAVGVNPFKYVPGVFRDLPPEVVSHSAECGELESFADKTVAVIGAGASATDLAALLAEKNATVLLIARTQELRFSVKSGRRRSVWRRAASFVKPVVLPGSGIGAGWLLKFCADAPWAFHRLPPSLRTRIVGKQLGPLGHSAMKDRIIGKLPLYLGRIVKATAVVDGRVKLIMTNGNQEEIVTVDHVIAATGYKIDVRRLGFLDENLLSRIATADGPPVLSKAYESSVDGLHFIGAASADSFGPVMRFVFGASHPSRRLAAHLAKQQSRGERRRQREALQATLRDSPFNVQATVE